MIKSKFLFLLTIVLWLTMYNFALMEEFPVKEGKEGEFPEEVANFVTFFIGLRTGYTNHQDMQVVYDLSNGKWEEIKQFIDDGITSTMRWILINSESAADFEEKKRVIGGYFENTRDLGEMRKRFYIKLITMRPRNPHNSQFLKYVGYIDQVNKILKEKIDVWNELIKSTSFDKDLKEKLIKQEKAARDLKEAMKIHEAIKAEEALKVKEDILSRKIK